MAPSQPSAPLSDPVRDPMIPRRQAIMALCAEAELEDLEAVLGRLAYEGIVEDLRHPFQPARLPAHRAFGHGAPSLTNASIYLYFWFGQ